MEIKIEITCSCGNESVVKLFSDQKKYTCEACGTELFKAHISNGYVYVLSNSSMPNLLKIGYTERDVDERVEELNSTGVPVPFEIEAIFGSPNAYEDEQAIHNILDQHRLASNREFFSIDLKKAIQCAIDCIGTDPSFLKSPDLLMSEDEKEEYLESLRKETFDEIQRLEKLRTKYINMSTEENRHLWSQVASQMIEDKTHLTEIQREIYSRFILNSFLVDEFNTTAIDKQEMGDWLSELEHLRSSYHGHEMTLEFLDPD